MTDSNGANQKYSTTRMLTVQEPPVSDTSNHKLPSHLFLPTGENRKGEGGLRTKGYFKSSQEGKPLITIITIVFNGEEFLEETILNVINQSYDNIEYIIIDGGSTDGTLNIIKKYEDAIDYWVSEKDNGISDAFNKGVSVSSSSADLINFMNAGDTFYNHTIVEEMTSEFPEDKMCDLLYGDVAFDDQSQGICGERITLFNGYKMPSAHQAFFYKRTVFENYGGYQNTYKLAMDYEHFLRIRPKIKVSYINKVVPLMTFEGVSNSTPSKTMKEYIRADIKYHNIYIFINVLRYLISFIRERL